MFLLDANACIRLLNGTSAPLERRLKSHRPAEIRHCSIVRAELYFGARHSTQVGPNLDRLRRFFEPVECVGFDDRAAEEYGLIRADLTRAGRLIGPNDLLIAAIGRANDLTLVTHNVDEFSRVVGLRIEDWERPA